MDPTLDIPKSTRVATIRPAMDCPKCGETKYSSEWSPTQWAQYPPAVASSVVFNCCKGCSSEYFIKGLRNPNHPELAKRLEPPMTEEEFQQMGQDLLNNNLRALFKDLYWYWENGKKLERKKWSRWGACLLTRKSDLLFFSKVTDHAGTKISNSSRDERLLLEKKMQKPKT